MDEREREPLQRRTSPPQVEATPNPAGAPRPLRATPAPNPAGDASAPLTSTIHEVQLAVKSRRQKRLAWVFFGAAGVVAGPVVFAWWRFVRQMLERTAAPQGAEAVVAASAWYPVAIQTFTSLLIVLLLLVAGIRASRKARPHHRRPLAQARPLPFRRTH